MADAPVPVGVLAGEQFDADYAELTDRLERETAKAIAELESSKSEQLAAIPPEVLPSRVVEKGLPHVKRQLQAKRERHASRPRRGVS